MVTQTERSDSDLRILRRSDKTGGSSFHKTVSALMFKKNIEWHIQSDLPPPPES